VGAALAAWSSLLDEFPFEAGLVAEAERERSRLFSEGHAELARLREAFERARFFHLADLYRRCADEAQALRTRYEGVEVGAEATALFGEIETEVAREEESRRAFERERLEAILGVVEREEWKGLSELVRGALKARGDG